MNTIEFTPTSQQKNVIGHDGSGFVAACPGAGKTRVMVERARCLFERMPPGCGIAILSFTRAAISELETRLRESTILPTPAYPSFIGTFDSFVWQFFIAPFGLAGSGTRPRLIPDMDKIPVKPFDRAHPLPLSCFDPSTAALDQVAAKRHGFDAAGKPDAQLCAYSTAATKIRSKSRERGELGFDEARVVAIDRLGDSSFSARLAAALSGRFREVIVDEAQDCNPDDLKIISWLHETGLCVKTICDPHQSIYEFRGGVTDQLFAFAERFDERDCPKLTGNFRSSQNICRAISQLRPQSAGTQVDNALGNNKDVPHAIHILSYSGKSVPASIGTKFCELVRDHGEDISRSPVVAATKKSGAKAIGLPAQNQRRDATLRLAEAVTNFHYAPRFNDMKAAIESVHRLILEIRGALSSLSYHQYVEEHEIKPETWRSQVISILRELKFDSARFNDARAWHDHAKVLFANHVTSKKGTSISQKLRWNADIETLLAATSADNVAARTIHSVKGMEFPAVCVVTTASSLKGILDFLETGKPQERAEDARELYVAASRAGKLLVFAAPKSQADRLAAHLGKQGAKTAVTAI